MLWRWTVGYAVLRDALYNDRECCNERSLLLFSAECTWFILLMKLTGTLKVCRQVLRSQRPSVRPFADETVQSAKQYPDIGTKKSGYMYGVNMREDSAGNRLVGTCTGDMSVPTRCDNDDLPDQEDGTPVGYVTRLVWS